jgi:hypothetical protein
MALYQNFCSEIVVLDDCDHFPYIEQPSQFFTELNNFSDKIEVQKD